MKRVLSLTMGVVAIALLAALGISKTKPDEALVPSTNATTMAMQNPRVVAGVIRRDGSVVSGTGFTVLHPGNGNYLITFSPPFSQIPAVSAHHIWAVGDPGNPGGSIYDTASIAGVNAQQVRVRTGFLQGVTQQIEDRDFSFIAVAR